MGMQDDDLDYTNGIKICLSRPSRRTELLIDMKQLIFYIPTDQYLTNLLDKSGGVRIFESSATPTLAVCLAVG